MVTRSRKWPTDQEILGAITDLAGDGFCSAHDLVTDSFRHVERRALRKAIGRAANRGLILERQGPDGRRYLAVATEGWRLIQAG